MRICCVVGTRPEAIKMGPLVMALRERSWAEVTLVGTGQHATLLDSALATFGLNLDEDLDAMRPGQSLDALTGRLFLAFGDLLARNRPDVVIGQGDTTSAMVAATCSFYRAIPFAHVEAGLRTGDLGSPFPEEFHRRVIAHAADLHFAPTPRARAALVGEGVRPDHVVLTGNTVIDALHFVLDARSITAAPPGSPRSILLTLHRRENLGQPIRQVFAAIRRIVERHEDVEVVYPVHPNPAVATVAREMLGDLERVRLLPALDYPDLVEALARCHLVLTDSGGLQEEAPSLAKPVLVLRHETERPEAVEHGVARLVGTDEETVFAETCRLLSDETVYAGMATGASPYGDGQASGRIVSAIAERFGLALDANLPGKAAVL